MKQSLFCSSTSITSPSPAHLNMNFKYLFSVDHLRSKNEIASRFPTYKSVEKIVVILASSKKIIIK